MSARSFQDPNFPADMARILPFVGNTVVYSQLGSGATDTATLTAPPTNSLIVDGGWYNRTAWTSSDGGTTGMTGAIGVVGNTDIYVEEGDIVALSAGVWSALGGVVKANMILTAAPAPVMEFVPTGGGADLDHINAGEGIACLFYARLPDGAKLWSMCDAATF